MNKKYNEELAAFDNSEVFHEFAKIAYDSGLADYDEKSVQVGTNRDAEKEKALKDLYNLEATTDQDKDGEELIEEAHKDKVEVLNSYLQDAGEFKNSIKTHKIMENVAKKPARLPNDVYHRNISAIKNLMDELIVVAEEMEVRDHPDLVSYADEILEGINSTGEMVKESSVTGFRRLSPLKTFLKYLAYGLAAAGVGYFVLSKFDSNKVFSVEGACNAYITALINYINDKQNLDPLVIKHLQDQISDINKFRTEYSKLKREFDRSIFAGDIEKGAQISEQINSIIEPVLIYIQEVEVELKNLEKEMKYKGTIEDPRGSFDTTKEIVQSVFSVVSTSSEEVILRNLSALKRSLEGDQVVRMNRVRTKPKLEMPEEDEDTIEV